MKKLNVLFRVVLCMTLLAGTLSACGKEQDNPTVPVDTQTVESTTEENKESEISVEESQTTQEPKETQTPEATPAPEYIDRSAAKAILDKMTTGWNLGNTLDAHGAGNSLSAETYWGNPKTTHEMIDAIAAQGFDSIRIPVTWAEHMGSAPDYIVDEAWMKRVEEVVNYALDNEMHVIINTHHEPSFWLTPSPEQADNVLPRFEALWKQIAEHFRDYDERLVFEGMNEVRTIGSEKEWSGGTEEERKVVDRLNAAFVKTVRATGGNNETRLLIISPYGNSAENDALRYMEIPDDPCIAVALHLYTPYHFTYKNDYMNLTKWDGSRAKDLENILTRANIHFMKKGIPVIITEYGCENKDNPEEVQKWLEHYLKLTEEYNLKCFWWDNNIYNTSGEKFGIFDRRNLKWYDQALADKIIELTKPAE